MEKSILNKDGPLFNLICKILPKSRNRDFYKSAEDMICDNLFSLPPFKTILYKEGIIWDDKTQSRSFLRLLHGHTFLGCLTDSYIKSLNKKYLEYGKSIIIDWIEKHQKSNTYNAMAYHDETTALRLQYWVRYYIYSFDQLEDESFFEQFEDEMWKTADLLSDDHFHSKNTNHGMFQDISLLVFALIFDEKNHEKCIQYKKKALKRLKQYFEFVYTSDGVHKEQSPAYHMLITSKLKKLSEWLEGIDKNLSEEFLNLYFQTEKFSIHILRPDGIYPPLGDSERKSVIKDGYKNLYENNEYLYSATGGVEGSVPKEKEIVFKDAGYAIFRDSWEKGSEATYILFSAAYNSNYHKHSDDLSLYIYSNGEIITEAGPNGYNYNDKYTQYAYSSSAHNTVIVDGIGLPRTDGEFDCVYIDNYNLSEEFSEVTGVNKRYKNVTHKRTVAYNKAKQEIQAKDYVESKEYHSYSFFWHIARDIKVVQRDGIFELFRDKDKVMEIELRANVKFTSRLISQQEKPDVLGWNFPKMEEKEPLSTLIIDLYGDNIQFTTLFRMANFHLNNKKSIFEQKEKVFHSIRNVRFLLEESIQENLKDKLTIFFISNSELEEFDYNYLKTFEEIKVNKLFILDDFSIKTTYYSEIDRDYSIETSVSSLIDYVSRKLGVKYENIISIGSFKNGYVALYFGLKKYFGLTILGSPQGLGEFPINQGKHINYMTQYNSVNAKEGDNRYLNGVLFNVWNHSSECAPMIKMLLVGDIDSRFNCNITPFLENLKENKYKYDLEIIKDTEYSSLKNVLPRYIQLEILKFFNLESPPFVKSIRILFDEVANSLSVKCDVIGDSLKYAYYVYKNEEVIEKIFYTNNSEMTYSSLGKGEYKVRVFIKNKNYKVVKNTKSILVK